MAEKETTSKSNTDFSLTADLILSAYLQGYFPMADDSGNIGFYTFEPRGMMPIDHRFKIRRSLRQRLKKLKYEVKIDNDFEQVIRTCSRIGVLPRRDLWLSGRLIDLYVELHKMGVAHCVEIWVPDDTAESGSKLIGGLYGLSIGSAFCGESMFSREDFGSQIALVELVKRLRERGYTMLDAQMPSDHMLQFGLFEVNHEEYMDMLRVALDQQCTFV